MQRTFDFAFCKSLDTPPSCIVSTMTTAPKSRWFRYSLRALFVVVTLAALVAWYSQPPGITIIGDISRSDVSAICEAVKKSGKDFGRPIMVIELRAPDKVEVKTWRVNGPLSGGGCDLKLEKQSGDWVVVDYELWMG
jgi:hypothetical protein